MTAFSLAMLGSWFFLLFLFDFCCCCGFTSESSGFSLSFEFFFLFKKIKSSRPYVLIVRILLLEHSHEVVLTPFVYFVK